MRTITLIINGEEKTFTVPFVSGLSYRKYIELQTRIKNPQILSVEEIDELVDIAVYTFNNSFTREQYYEGTPYDQIIPTIENLYISPTEGNGEGNEKK